MAGERSKEIGEKGEKVVSRLLEIMGWNPHIANTDITCYRPELHEKKLGKHGIDYIKYYKCPLHAETQKTILVSAKYNEDYPADPSTQVKGYIYDLGRGMFCFKLDREHGKHKVSPDIREIQVRGVVFCLQHSGDFNDSVVARLGKFKNAERAVFDPIFVVDNKAATFVYSIYLHFRASFPNKEIQFSYPKTSLNIGSFDKYTSSRLLPLEFLTSNIIPVRVEDASSKVLALYINEEFSDQSLSTLIGFVHDYTNGWANKIRILYPDYRELSHRVAVDRVFSDYADQDLINDISVESFHPVDFRKLEEN